jgi:hypothetical protein
MRNNKKTLPQDAQKDRSLRTSLVKRRSSLDVKRGMACLRDTLRASRFMGVEHADGEYVQGPAK